MATANVRLTCLAMLASVVLASAPTSAQDALAQDEAERRRDLARTLFGNGVAHVQAQEWAAAEDSFRQALQNHDAPSIRYNLASVLAEQGEYPEASSLVDSVLRDTTTPEDIRAHATELRGTIDAHAGYARVEVTGAADATVAVDGYPLSDASAEVPLAPGTHVATASRSGEELARESVEIATGEHRTVTVAVPLPEPVVEEVVAPEQAAEPPVTEQWWFWTAIGGAVVVAAVIGISVAVAAPGSGVQAPVQGDFQPGVIRW